MKKALNKIWNSPTITTWLSFSIKSLPFVLVIPMMLTSLDAATINVWNLFISIITIQNLIDIGFGSTFVRGFAYASKGIGDFTDNSSKIDWETNHLTKDQIINDLHGTMNVIYKWLYFIQVLLVGIGGTYLLVKPIELTTNNTECWYSWIFIVFTSGFALFSRKNINILLGFNYVALQKRVDAIINFSFLFFAIVFFYFTKSIFYFILFSQAYHIINFFVLKRLVSKKVLEINSNSRYSKEIFRQIWPSAWKSFLGVVFSSGLTQFTNLIYAQYATAINSAVYGIYLRVVTGISAFSQAPFYSKVPLLTSLRAKNKHIELYKKAKTFMFRSHIVFLAGFLLFELFGLPIFNMLGKEIQLNSPYLFYLLVFAFIFERYGAMHIQLVSTSNKIIWHIANGFNGLFIIIFILVFHHLLGVLVFPLSLLLGNILIYAPIAVYSSYVLYGKKKYKDFEGISFIVPLLILTIITFVKFIR